MVRVYHVDVVEVSRRRFIGEVNGVFKGKIPYREGLKLCVAGFVASEILVIKL